MSEGLEKRLREALGPSPLAERLASVGAPFLERSELHAPLEALRGEALAGLARVLASSAESARYLVSRPALVERIATGVRPPVNLEAKPPIAEGAVRIAIVMEPRPSGAFAILTVARRLEAMQLAVGRNRNVAEAGGGDRLREGHLERCRGHVDATAKTEAGNRSPPNRVR